MNFLADAEYIEMEKVVIIFINIVQQDLISSVFCINNCIITIILLLLLYYFGLHM